MHNVRKSVLDKLGKIQLAIDMYFYMDIDFYFDIEAICKIEYERSFGKYIGGHITLDRKNILMTRKHVARSAHNDYYISSTNVVLSDNDVVVQYTCIRPNTKFIIFRFIPKMPSIEPNYAQNSNDLTLLQPHVTEVYIQK
jgi:hypothetical protein